MSHRGPKALSRSRWRHARLGGGAGQEGGSGEGGFTLIELLIVVIILPIVIGGATLAVTAVLTNTKGTSNRISDSADAQITSAVYVRDVQSASLATTDSAATRPLVCGTGTSLVLGMSWTSGGLTSVASYWDLNASKGAVVSYQLIRRFCQYASASGGTSNPIESRLVARGVSSSEQAVLVSCATSCAPASGWVSTAGMLGITLSVTEPASGYRFSLVGVPQAWTPQSGGVSGGGAPLATPPLLLLGTGCTILTASGGAAVTIGTGPPAGTGIIGVNSTCDNTLQLSGSAALNASAIDTVDPTGKSLATANLALPLGSASGSVTQYPTTETVIGGAFTDPDSSLVAPVTPNLHGTSARTCTGSTSLVCSPGLYSTAPALNGGVTAADFTAGTYDFTTPVDITSGVHATFDAGSTIVFEQGLTIDGASYVTLGAGTYIFASTANSSCDSLNITAGPSGGAVSVSSAVGGALLYIASGQMCVTGGRSITLKALSGFPAIWDPAATTSSPLELQASGSISSVGAVFAPSGAVDFSGAANLSVSQLVSGSLSLVGSGSVTIG